jgi:hypothetical protein
VRLLLSRGVEFRARGQRHGNTEAWDNKHRTSLQVTSNHGNLNAVQCLLVKGEDDNACSGQYFGTALHAAAAHRAHEVVPLLLKHGAKVQSTAYFTILQARHELGAEYPRTKHGRLFKVSYGHIDMERSCGDKVMKSGKHRSETRSHSV